MDNTDNTDNIDNTDNTDNIENTAIVLQSLNVQQKMELKKMIKKEYGNKYYDQKSYDDLLTTLANKYNVNIKSVTKFINKYITITDDNILINIKKVDKLMEIQKRIKYTEDLYGPFGTQWIHDKQEDDTLTEDEIRISGIFEELSKIISPDQRTIEWKDMRHTRITASDGGSVLGVNEKEREYKFILKKVVGSTFKGNEFCYHGKKYEDIGTIIYEYRMNVSIRRFGLIGHPKYKFLGASPDGIVGKYKLDGVHLTKYVGRMLEIKCPYIRTIVFEGTTFEICPIYYWVQVQLQLECCDLDVCDFWQCKFEEYDDFEDFENDTMPDEQFRSIKTGFEKGCIIQLMPKEYEGEYLDVMYDNATFIIPPKIEMTPKECEIWIKETTELINTDSKYENVKLDKIFYWRLEHAHCLTIDRDKKWFNESLPTLSKMWDYVEFFRADSHKTDILVKYIDSLKMKYNNKIMKVVEELYNVPKDTSDDLINKLIENKNKKNMLKDEKNGKSTYSKYNKVEKTFNGPLRNSTIDSYCDSRQKFNNNAYAFADDATINSENTNYDNSVCVASDDEKKQSKEKTKREYKSKNFNKFEKTFNSQSDRYNKFNNNLYAFADDATINSENTNYDNSVCVVSDDEKPKSECKSKKFNNTIYAF